MKKIQVYMREAELAALRKAAARSGRSVAQLIRDVVRETVLRPRAMGPVAIWDGEPKRRSLEHDSVHEAPRSIRKAGRGEETVITRRGQPVARLVPIALPKKAFRSLADFRATLPKARTSSADLIRRLRDEG